MTDSTGTDRAHSPGDDRSHAADEAPRGATDGAVGEAAGGSAHETQDLAITGVPAGHVVRVPGPDYLVAGRYRLRSKIGGGGMGAVWLAVDELLHREVAAKQVISTAGMTEREATELRERALHEGRIAARLGHHNAVAMYDVALDRGEPWLLMEYLPSRSLAQVLHMTGTLPALQVAQIGAQVADALAGAHTVGITHRDVKPGNILIANQGRAAGTVKLTDFGIARTKDDARATPSGVITGTPAYLAPEVARGVAPSEKSDLYSLGATLYTAVEGIPPFGIEEDSLVLLHRVARGEINPPKSTGPLMTVILAMLEPHPDRRPNLREARDRLALVAADGGSAAAVLSSPLRATDGAPPVWMRHTSGRASRSFDSGRSPGGPSPSRTGRPAAAENRARGGAGRTGSQGDAERTGSQGGAGRRPTPTRTAHPPGAMPENQQLYSLPEQPPMPNAILVGWIALGLLLLVVVAAVIITLS